VNVNGQGIQVYKNDAVFPLLQEGQLVRINGEMSTSREERRIKVTSAGSLEPLESVSLLQATNLALSTINATAHGQFISTQGMIVSRSATEILLEDQGTQLVIGISDYATIDTTVFNKGDLLRAQGMVVSQTGSLKLKPRSQDDLEIIAQETPAVTTATISGKDRATSTQQKQALLLGLGTGVVLLAYALRKYHPKFNSSYVAKHALPLSTQTIR
jgi:DNA/RNA endonuclease YhcR with UshA esterase domain